MRLTRKDFRDWGAQGGRIGARRLLQAQVRQSSRNIAMMNMRLAGYSDADIGRDFHVSRQRVGQILRRMPKMKRPI